MITITCTTKVLADRAEQIMSDEVLYNPKLSGASYVIERGDFDSIDCSDEITGTELYISIFRQYESY